MSEEHLTAESAKSAKGLGSERPGGLLSAIGYAPGRLVAGLLALLFAGAIFWATGRDPFRRIWFSVKFPGQGKAQCVAVLPKNSLKSRVQSLKSGGGRWPVVVYLHGSGGSLLGDGNELRQMAEMGLAVVGMEDGGKAESGPVLRSSTAEGGKQKAEMEGPGAGSVATGTEDGFDAQFSALLNYLGRQSWADTNRMAWVGYSLGAQHALAFALHHPGSQPRLLVLLAGGWVPELEQFKVQSSGFEVQSSGFKVRSSGFKVQGSLVQPSTLNSQPSTSALLFHGERDEVFPLSEARRVAACLETNGVPVELEVLPGQGHDLGANRLLVFRVIGEQCLIRLGGPDALANYRSILSWQAQAKPLWLFWTPALVWTALWLCLRRKVGRASRLPSQTQTAGEAGTEVKPEVGSRGRSPSPGAGGTPALRWWELGLRWLAAVLGAAALAQTALHLVPPRLPISERTLAIARKHLVAPKEKCDFEFLAEKPIWSGKRLGTLLEHVELAHYNRELVNWKLDDQTYRDFVLSAQIDPAADGALNWRRPLWENFYPRIRREQDPAAAAETVVRFLRERVSVAQGSGLPSAVAEIWQRQITSARGFEAVYVAALRSVGIPARLGLQGRAEFWTGSTWQAAPRPLVEEWK